MRMPMTDARFEPDFYTAGPARFYLPLLHDIVLSEKPGLIVTLGLGDAQAHLAFCQAALGQSPPRQALLPARPQGQGRPPPRSGVTLIADL